MRIDAFNKISKLYETSSTKSTVKTSKASFADKLEISKTGKDYQFAKQIVAKTPDIREDKVNEIKQQMAAGLYNVDAKEVAEKLVERYFDQQI